MIDWDTTDERSEWEAGIQESNKYLRMMKNALYERLIGDNGRYYSMQLYSKPSYNQGFRIFIPMWPTDHAYIYVFPWARGWSVFVSPRDDETSTTWREVPEEYKGMQCRLTAERGVMGAWNVPVNDVVDKINEYAAILKSQSDAKRAVYMKDNWQRGLLWYFAKFAGNNPTLRHDLPWNNSQLCPPNKKEARVAEKIRLYQLEQAREGRSVRMRKRAGY